MGRVLVAEVMTDNEWDDCPSYMVVDAPVNEDSRDELSRAMTGVANLCEYTKGHTLYNAEFSLYGFVRVDWLRYEALPDGIDGGRGYEFRDSEDIDLTELCEEGVELESIRFGPDFRGAVQFRGCIRHTNIEFYTTWIDLDALLLGEDDDE